MYCSWIVFNRRSNFLYNLFYFLVTRIDITGSEWAESLVATVLILKFSSNKIETKVWQEYGSDCIVSSSRLNRLCCDFVLSFFFIFDLSFDLTFFFSFVRWFPFYPFHFDSFHSWWWWWWCSMTLSIRDNSWGAEFWL